MKLILLFLALSFSEGRLYTFQPFTYYQIPLIPHPVPQTAVSPQHVPISPRFLVYPINQQLGVNSPFPPHNVNPHFLTPRGNVVITGDDLRQEIESTKVDEASAVEKTTFVPEEYPGGEQLIKEESLNSDAGFGSPQQATGDNPGAGVSASVNSSPGLVPQQQTSRIRTEDGLGGYHFRYSEGSSSRDERRDHRGTVRGSYGVADPSGKIRTYHYVADEGGFRITGPGLPTQNLLETPSQNEISNEPAKKSLQKPIWPDTIQENVHEFPVVSEPGRSKSEMLLSESPPVKDLNNFGDVYEPGTSKSEMQLSESLSLDDDISAIRDDNNKIQLAHPYMSQAAYEAVYGTPAVSVLGNVPASNNLNIVQPAGFGSTTPDPVEVVVLDATTTEGGVSESTTTEAYTNTEPITMETSTTPLRYYL